MKIALECVACVTSHPELRSGSISLEGIIYGVAEGGNHEARTYVYRMACCPREIRRIDDAHHYHGTTLRVAAHVMWHQRFQPSGHNTSAATESCAATDAVFCGTTHKDSFWYATPFAFTGRMQRAPGIRGTLVHFVRILFSCRKRLITLTMKTHHTHPLC